MLQQLRNILHVPELKRKIGYTLVMLFFFRLGSFIPVPLSDPGAMKEFWRTLSSGGAGGVFDVINMFSGGAFQYMSIFALGIMPYISASIILQLLMVVWPRLEKIAKEGQAGQKKINQYTRYGTIGLALFQSIGLAILMLKMTGEGTPVVLTPNTPLFIFITMVSMTTGTAFLMWMGERITEFGVGNGISLIIAWGIVADYVPSIYTGVQSVRSEAMQPIWLPLIVALCVAVSAAIIYFQQATRKLPVQYARRVVGRKQFQGASTFLPLKLNTAGVIPVIFASAILTFPGIILSFFTAGSQQGGLSTMFDINSRSNLYNWLHLDQGGIFNLLKALNLYTVLYAVMTIFFCYFYTAITFNPLDTAENLKKMGGFIPGRRPGKQTADHIDYVLTRITSVGSLYLVAVALVPTFLSVSFGVPYKMAYIAGGTGLIIVVGVVLETMKQIESQLLMRHYEGFEQRRSARRWQFGASS